MTHDLAFIKVSYEDDIENTLCKAICDDCIEFFCDRRQEITCPGQCRARLADRECFRCEQYAELRLALEESY